MQELSGKNVLLLVPSFFGYDIEIRNELKYSGATVFHYDERPTNDFFTKVFIRLNLKKLIQNKIDAYYDNIFNEIKDKKLDYLFLIDPESIDNNKIKIIKKYHPDIKVYIYMWDSIKNRKKSLDLLMYSDKFFTFDSKDKTIHKNIKFLPLFYINDYKNISSVINYKYDFTFIGTIHSDRYNIVKKIEKFTIENNLKVFFYFYSPSKILFFLQRLLKKDFKNIDKNDISFSSMSKNDVIQTISKSKIIIDIHHPQQDGLTMRTLEILGAKRKLLTTNKNIKEYDFYDENNISIFDRNNIEISNNFVKSVLNSIDIIIYDKYSINSWIEAIFKE
jgi:hypothetical protein